LTLLTVLSVALIADLDLSRLDALILLLVFGGLMAWTIYQGLKQKDDSLANEIETEGAEKAMPLKRAVFWLVAGLLLLIASSRILVWGAVEIAQICKRKVGDVDSVPSRDALEAGLEYIRNTPQVRDVLLSGGDPLMLSDDKLDWLLTQLDAIEHVDVVRIGTRTPVVLPYRITDELVAMLARHHPLWINTHFNHPRELTASSRRAVQRLADAGIPLGNQSVLLAGVNDCQRLIRTLNQKLVKNRIRPYYLYQCDLSEGLTHFRTPIGKGIEIIESLRGHTSGFAVPTYVVDAPGGGGKIPVMPNYVVSWGPNKVVLRNYEGVITTYHEPESYEANYCDRECAKCNLQLKEDDAVEKAIGIEKLLSDWDDTTSLTPESNERMGRRDDAA
jgi:lysine 2,3-aminomutase